MGYPTYCAVVVDAPPKTGDSLARSLAAGGLIQNRSNEEVDLYKPACNEQGKAATVNQNSWS